MKNIPKRRLTLFLGFLMAACGGSPTGPSVAATPTPAPTYPVLTGGWGGTWSAVAIYTDGSRLSSSCSMTWIVPSQTGGSFSGTFTRTGGGVVDCAEVGTVSGQVSLTGALTFAFVTSSQSSCVRIAGSEGYGGVVSTTGGLTAQQVQTIRCSSGSLSVQGDRTAIVSLNRR